MKNLIIILLFNLAANSIIFAQNTILDSLYDYIKKLSLQEATEWGDYYTKTNYDAQAFEAKKKLIKKLYMQVPCSNLKLRRFMGVLRSQLQHNLR